MNFWSEPEPLLVLAAGLFNAVVAISVFPDPGWWMCAATTTLAFGALIWMRAIHWWDFDE